MSLFAVDPSYGDCGNGNGDGSCSRTTGGGVSKNFLAAAAVAEALAAVEHLHNQQQQKQEQLNHKTHTTLSSSSIPMDSTSSEFNLPIMSATVNDHTPGVDMADWLNLLSNNIITNNSKQDSENSQEFYLNEISYSSESKSHFVNDINIGGHFQNINHQLLPQQQNHSPSNEFKNSVAPAAEQTTDVVSQSQQLATALIDFFGDNRPLNSFKKTSTPDKTEIKKSGGKKTGSCSSSSSSSSRNSVQSAVKPAKVKSKLNTCSNNNNNVGSTKANQSRKQKQRQIIQESSAQHERISSSQESVVVSPLLLNHGTGQVHFDAHLLNETSTLESSPLVRDYQSQEQLQQQWQWQNFISSDNNNNTNNNNNNNNNSGTGNNMLFELPMNSIAAIQQPAEANQLPMSSNFQMQRESASDDFTQQPDFLALLAIAETNIKESHSSTHNNPPKNIDHSMTSPTFFPAADPSNYNNNKQPEVVNQFIDFTSELLKSLQAESCLSKVSNNDGIDQNQLIVNSSTMLECFPLSSSPLTTMPLPQQSTQTDPLFNTNNSIMHISSSTPRPKRDYSDLFYLQGFLSSSSSSPVSSTSPSKLIQEVELPLSNKRQRPLGPSDSSTTCPSVSRCSTKPAPYYSSPSATSAPKQSAAKIQNFNHRSSPETKQQQLQIAPRPDPNSVSKQKSPSPSHSPNQPAVHITTDSAIECGADLVTSISSGKRLRAIQLISHIIMYKVEISYESAQLAIMEAVKKNQYDILASLLSEFKMHVTFKLLEEAAQIPIIFEHKSTRAHTAATRTRRCLHIYFGKKERDVKLLHHFASKQVQNISELILLLIDDTRLFSDYDLEAALQQSIHDHTVSVFETFIHYKRSRLRDARLLDWCLLQIVFALKHSPSIQAAFLQSMFPYRLDVNFLPKITALRAAVASKFDPTSFRIHDLITDAELATASQEDRKWMIDEALRLNFIHGILRMDLSPEENLYARRNAWRLGMATLCAALESKSSHKPRSKLLVSSPPSFST